MSDYVSELQKIEVAIAAQESLRGILPDKQLEAALVALREKRTALQAQSLGTVQEIAVNQTNRGQAVVHSQVGGHVLGTEAAAATGLGSVAVSGERNVVILAAANSFWQQFAAQRSEVMKLSPAELQQTTAAYLVHLVDRYRYLDFKGMGVSDRVALRMPLLEMYIPLRARVELPEGETWARQLYLAGRPVSSKEAEVIGWRMSDPIPLLGLLTHHDGLIILGDPGAGKTTFLKYLALHLALGQGEALKLGVRLPILVPLSAYANALAQADIPLSTFIETYSHQRGIDLPIAPMLTEALARGGVLLLMDGLDEVKDQGQRRLVVDRVVDFFTFQRRRGNKFILTSRIVGYREVRPMVEGLVECTLVDFDDEEIIAFVERWTEALERAAQGNTVVATQQAAKERAELLDTVQHNPGVRQLAANPLLLTILALMKRQGVSLPQRRVELYQKYIEILLRQWNLVRGLDRPPGRDLDVVETIRVLAPLALWMHDSSPGVGLVKREAVRRELQTIYTDRGEIQPEQAARQLLTDAHDYAGLLLERGPGEYGFIHLTFQEYLAAVAIAQQGQQDISPVVDMLTRHIDDDNWREVSLLTIGYLGIVQQRDQAAGAVLQELIRQGPGEPGQATILAGEAVLDAWPGGVTLAGKVAVVEALLATMGDEKVTLAHRVAAGRLLGRLGDPRPGVVTLPPLLTPPLEGEFLYGEKKEVREIAPFQAGVYPVTNAQFAQFIAANGYDTPTWWSEQGWQQRQQEGWLQPRLWENNRWNNPNHPVVGVSWFEAEAFCHWLTSVHSQLYRLPTEEEWEQLARGQDGYEYPWGTEWQPGRANTFDRELKQTSPVGMFLTGVSPTGVYDCIGNVWEWCWEWYDKRQAARVLRGGSWGYLQSNAHCASRDRYEPASRLDFIGFRVVAAPL